MSLHDSIVANLDSTAFLWRLFQQHRSTASICARPMNVALPLQAAQEQTCRVKRQPPAINFHLQETSPRDLSGGGKGGALLRRGRLPELRLPLGRHGGARQLRPAQEYLGDAPCVGDALERIGV